MAGENVPLQCRYFKNPTNPVSGVTHFRITAGILKRDDGGAAGSPGRAACQIQNQSVRLELFGRDWSALLALIGSTAANGVIGTKAGAGVNEKITLKNVFFDEAPGAINVPDKDTGGLVERYCVAGSCIWGDGDTLPVMIVGSADT